MHVYLVPELADLSRNPSNKVVVEYLQKMTEQS